MLHTYLNLLNTYLHQQTQIYQVVLVLMECKDLVILEEVGPNFFGNTFVILAKAGKHALELCAYKALGCLFEDEHQRACV